MWKRINTARNSGAQATYISLVAKKGARNKYPIILPVLLVREMARKT